ncbi:hypothetical protein E1B28_003652 [Marasmius oreades]|uniref:Uncharacterized protein n=1 Tax=Marasmius oreades TaxID=181124 RepID=A0A9P7UWX8_9AGAR|nr:uncharacterized protein E1B28_003652 [Marasmius oreades]KAG7096201.1 hypothetical protein E1B28_003652 [Marasmius oreades]
MTNEYSRASFNRAFDRKLLVDTFAPTSTVQQRRGIYHPTEAREDAIIIASGSRSRGSDRMSRKRHHLSIIETHADITEVGSSIFS